MKTFKLLTILSVLFLTGCDDIMVTGLNDNQRMDYFKKKFNTERVTIIQFNRHSNSKIIIQADDGGLYWVELYGWDDPENRTIQTIFLPKGK